MPISRDHPVTQLVGQSIGAFTLDPVIGKGAFGVVYQGTSSHSKAAFKFIVDVNVAAKEIEVLQTLDGINGVPRMMLNGELGGFQWIMQRLAYQNLCQLKCKNDGEIFSNNAIQKLTWHALNILEEVHSRGYLHQDIKNNNMMVSHPGPKNVVMLQLIDFGLAVRYQDENGNVDRSGKDRHLAMRVHSTPRVLKGEVHERIDDITMLSYMMWGMKSLPMDRFKGELNTVWTFKQGLLRTPQSTLPEPLKWFHPFYEEIGEQEATAIIDYEKLRSAIRMAIADANPESNIQLNENFQLI